jgi:hypothetical protein
VGALIGPDPDGIATLESSQAAIDVQLITACPTLPRDLGFPIIAQRSVGYDYGSEGWGFDSLPARERSVSPAVPELVMAWPGAEAGGLP